MATKGRWMVFVAAVMLVGLFGTLGSAEQIVLTAYTSGDLNYLYSTRLFFDEVERRFPDIKIEMETGTLEKFLVMYSGGIVPDLLRLYNNVHEYAQQGLIQSLEPFIENSSFRREDFVPILLERSLSYNGELYSIPFGISIAAFFVNVERFEEAGLTVPDETWRWEVEGREAAQRLTRINPDSGEHDYFFGSSAL